MDARSSEVRPGRGYSLVEDNPEQIKGQIDRTRANMDETIDAISERLRPRRLVDEFLEMFMGRRMVVQSDVETQSGELHAVQEISGGDLIHAVKRNPVPAALIGAGVAYYLYSRTRPSRGSGGMSMSGREVGGYGERDWLAPGATFEEGSSGGIRDKAGSAMGRIKDKVGQRAGDLGHRAMDSARDKASSAMHTVGEKASGALHTVGEKASDAVHTAATSAGRGVRNLASSAGSSLGSAARSAVHGTGDALSSAAHSAKDHLTISREQRERLKHRAGDMASGVRDTVEEYPLLIGGAALVVGLVAGLSAPPTRTERRYLGPIRDDLMEDAREAVSEARETIGETMREVGQAAGNAAAGKISEGSGGIAERLSSAAGAAIHSAGDKVREKVPNKDDDADRGDGQFKGKNDQSGKQGQQSFQKSAPPIGGSGGGSPGGGSTPSTKPPGPGFQPGRTDNPGGNQKR